MNQEFCLEEDIRSETDFAGIVGQSSALRQVLQLVEMVAASDATVLLLGETGTGKEVIVRAINERSRRKGRPFVKISCSAIPAGLLESELFGHERGAFTGAAGLRIGRFESANRGTIFLDEIGELPLELQPKLLRVLQEREFERLGGTRTFKVDVRVVAATNRDLAQMVEDKGFREDLYYRLNVFPITVPPLRQRAGDIPLLIDHFVRKYSQRMEKRIDLIPSDVIEKLCCYDWPGNVRELQNVIERAVIISHDGVLVPDVPEPNRPWRPRPGQGQTLVEIEREHIVNVLREFRWKIGGPSGAAARLGMNRSTLNFKIKKLGIRKPGTEDNLLNEKMRSVTAGSYGIGMEAYQDFARNS